MKSALLITLAIIITGTASSQSVTLTNINQDLKDTVLIGIKNKVTVTGLSMPIESATAEKTSIKIDGQTLIVHPTTKGPLFVKISSGGEQFNARLIAAYAADPKSKISDW